MLSRKKDEKIRIGDDIEIVIVDIRGDKVRVGLHAPANVPVHREEVYQAIQRQKLANQPIRVPGSSGSGSSDSPAESQ